MAHPNKIEAKKTASAKMKTITGYQDGGSVWDNFRKAIIGINEKMKEPQRSYDKGEKLYWPRYGAEKPKATQSSTGE